LERTRQDSCARTRQADEWQRLELERKIAEALPEQTRRVGQQLYGAELTAARAQFERATEAELARSLSIWTVRAQRCRAIALDQLRAPAAMAELFEGVVRELERWQAPELDERVHFATTA